jgi:hypothetical protein
MMPTKRYTVRLYWQSSRESEEVVRLDPRSTAALRSVLERMVEVHQGAAAGDLSGYSIVVQSRGNGLVYARCRVTTTGVTEVER